MVLVSIILPTYNRAKIVGRAIHSILSQTYSDFELIVIDDSTDETDRVVAGFSDDRIIYLREKQKQGVSKARNKGLKLARGKYVSFIDSDDLWFPNKLKKEIDVFEKLDKSFGVVYCSSILIQNEKKITVSFEELGSGDLSYKILEKWPVLGASLIRKVCIQKTGIFDPEIECGEDIDLLIRISQLFKFYYIDEPLILVSRSNKSLSANWSSDLHGRKMRLKKYPEIYRNNPRALSQELLYISLCYAYKGTVKTCRTYLCKGIKIYPRSLRCYLAYLVSFLGNYTFRQAINFAENFKNKIR